MMSIEEISARLEIEQLVARYMRGLDRLDAALLRSTFHDDATTDYGFFQGGPDEFVAMAMGALADHSDNHHMIGQVILDIQGQRATGEVYFQAFHRVHSNGEARDLFIAGRYVDVYECRDNVWKILSRAEVNDWSRNDPASDSYFTDSPNGLRGGRQDDRSYNNKL